MLKSYIAIIFIIAPFLNLTAQKIIILKDTTAAPEVDLGEIVIAASRDSSKLKKLPSSVSIIPTGDVEKNDIVTMGQITGIAPNFMMPDYGSRLTSPVYIRGIGSRINAPSVGLYVDNVPYLEKASFDFDFFDIERIEILRGPQGTLYGRNTMGGLINIKTLSPMNFQGTKIKLTVGEYGYYNFNAGHYQRIKNKMGFSLAANFRHNDGFYTNKYSGDKVDGLNSFGLRNRWIYKISDDFFIENIASFENMKQGGYPYAVYNDSLSVSDDINYNQNSSYNRKMFSDGLRLVYTQPKWELSGTFSYQWIDGEQSIDQDFTSDSLYFITQLQTQNMLSGEIILRSRNNKKFNWLFGIFGFSQLFDKSVEVNIYQRDMSYLKLYDLHVSSLGFFHQMTYEPIENLTLSAGLRYDMDKSKLGYNYNQKLGGKEKTPTDTIYPEEKNTIPLPKISANYQFNNMNIYLSYTSGYKPGGYNSTFEKPEHLTFKDEKSHSYEAGIKSSLFNKHLYADLAIFRTHLEGQQIYRTVPSGRGSYLDNAGRSENKGFEVSLKNKSLLGIEGMLSYGFTHSKILEYVKDSTTNYNDHSTPYIPRHTLALSLSKTFRFDKFSLLDKIRIHALYRQIGTKYWNLENTYKQNTYNLLNAKVSFMYKSLNFEIWGRNILNTDYYAFLFEALGRTYTQKGKPMQVGMNLAIDF